MFYLCFKDYAGLPPMLGGPSQTIFMLNFPCTTFPDTLESLYAIMFGYYTYNTVDQIVNKWHHPDVWEHLLHHQVTIMLIFTSYYTQYWDVGAMVSFCHDISDVFVFNFKLCYELLPFVYGVASYLLMFVSYFYTRLYAFPYVLYIFYRDVEFIPLKNVDWPDCVRHQREIKDLYMVLCIALFVVHIFWAWLLIKGFYYRIISKTKIDITKKHM